MATRVLAAYYKLKQDTNYPALNLNAPVQADHATLIRQIAAAGTTLLKNKNKALPIQKPASIAIIGSDAGANPDGVNSCTDRNCNKGVLSMGTSPHLHLRHDHSCIS
jgi:beta-glucosidase